MYTIPVGACAFLSILWCFTVSLQAFILYSWSPGPRCHLAMYGFSLFLRRPCSLVQNVGGGSEEVRGLYLFQFNSVSQSLSLSALTPSKSVLVITLLHLILESANLQIYSWYARSGSRRFGIHQVRNEEGNRAEFTFDALSKDCMH